MASLLYTSINFSIFLAIQAVNLFFSLKIFLYTTALLKDKVAHQSVQLSVSDEEGAIQSKQTRVLSEASVWVTPFKRMGERN